MKVPRLKANIDVEGSVVFPEDWADLPWIVRADLLQDWICDLNTAYGNALADIRKLPRK